MNDKIYSIFEYDKNDKCTNHALGTPIQLLDNYYTEHDYYYIIIGDNNKLTAKQLINKLKELKNE